MRYEQLFLDHLIEQAGKQKMKTFQGFRWNSGFIFAVLETIHLLLGSLYYGTSTLGNGIGCCSMLFRKNISTGKLGLLQACFRLILGILPKLLIFLYASYGTLFDLKQIFAPRMVCESWETEFGMVALHGNMNQIRTVFVFFSSVS